MTSLNTKLTPNGIQCSLDDGRVVGVIAYKTAKDGEPCDQWVAEPTATLCMPEHRAFKSLEAAKFYMLAVAAERLAVNQI